MEKMEIANKIKENGGTLYLVGGAVRDEILKKGIHDEDYCVTGISVQKFEKIFPKLEKKGKFFGVYEINKKEIALARKETKTGIGHKNFSIKLGKKITIEEDLSRRDITINSIAKEVLTGKIIDPYNGIQDIKNKTIRATTENFKEDPLRVYRVARFASQLEFKVEENTIKMMKDLKEELTTLSKERVFEEFRKALQTEKPSIFFEILKKAEVLDVHFKEINNLIGSKQLKKSNIEGDLFNHTMIVIDTCAKQTQNLQIRYSALLHNIGKYTKQKELQPDCYDQRVENLVEKISNKIGVPKIWKQCAKTAAKENMLGGIFNQITPKKKVDFITRVSKSRIGLDGMKIIVQCDKSMYGNIAQNINFDKIGKEMLEKINGEYIEKKYNIKNEKRVGELLRKERIEWIKKI